MSFTSRTLMLSLLLLASSAWAQRIYFGDSSRGIQADFQSHTLVGDFILSPVEIRLSIPAIDIEDVGDGFNQIRASGLFPLDIPGRPELYTTGTLLAVPEGFEPHIQTVQRRQREIKDVLVAPAQQKFRCSHARDGFEFDAALYDSRSPYPSSAVSLVEAGKLQGLRLVRVAINPFQTIGASRMLYVTYELVARVHFTQTRKQAQPSKMSPIFYQIARNTTVNGQQLGAWLQPAEAAEVMLILVGDELKDSIGSLVQWKEAKGLTVKVITLSEAGGTKESMKAYLQKFYDASTVKPTYLLFVGNKTTMPAFMESTSSGSAASDYSMSLLSGNDSIPDALYGRVIADNASEVALQIQRWIDYEKSPATGSWFPRGVTIASSEGYNPSDKEYAEMVTLSLKQFTYQHVSPFLQGEGNATPENITTALDEGASWLTYFGHGSGTSWSSTNGSFSNSEVQKLNNAGKLPIIIDVACQNGSWVNISKCFGKAWVNHTMNASHAGAVAFLGGSVNISWHPPAVMSVGIAKYHFEKPVHSMGGSVLAGQLYLVEKMGTGSNVTDNIKWYNLFGDPSMLIRTDIPKTYSLSQIVSKRPLGVTVDVKAKDSTGGPVVGLLASLNAPSGKQLAVGKTDTMGNVSLTVSSVGQLEPNTQLTTTGYNLETQQVVVD